MEKLLLKLEKLNRVQKELMRQMSLEKCTDILSVIRSKALAESIIELEIKIEVLKDVIILYNK
jgi:hypothetical protein